MLQCCRTANFQIGTPHASSEKRTDDDGKLVHFKEYYLHWFMCENGNVLWLLRLSPSQNLSHLLRPLHTATDGRSYRNKPLPPAVAHIYTFPKRERWSTAMLWFYVNDNFLFFLVWTMMRGAGGLLPVTVFRRTETFSVLMITAKDICCDIKACSQNDKEIYRRIGLWAYQKSKSRKMFAHKLWNCMQEIHIL